MTRYSDHFTREELGDELTGEIHLADGFIDKLETLREAYGKPMIVTDGCRVIDTNEWLIRRGYGASLSSFHLIENPKWETGGCCAVDIARPRFADLGLLAATAYWSEWAVGIGETFVHLDRRVDYTDLSAGIYTYDG